MKSRNKIKIFVIMPFGKSGSKEHDKSSFLYKNILKPTLEDFSDFVKRADEFDHIGNISKDIIEHLFYSDIVIADLTGQNANVFYELGVRHSFRKNSTIPIAKMGETIPFDVSPYRAIFYNDDEMGLLKLQSELKSKIILALNQPQDHIDNPVYDAMELKLSDLLSINDSVTKSSESYKKESERLRGLLSKRNGDVEKLDSKISNLNIDLNRKEYRIELLKSLLSTKEKNELQSNFLKVKEDYWEKSIQNSKNSFVVLVTGSWFENNDNIENQLTKIASQYNDYFILIRFDLEKATSLANKLEIKNLPAVLFVKEGKIIDKYEGVKRDAVYQGVFNSFY